jgi:hypothetical protein
MAPFLEAFQNLRSSFVVERDIVRALPMLFRRLTVTGNPTSPIKSERRAPDWAAKSQLKLRWSFGSASV